MQRILLSSKIHRARITETALDYSGSITLDADLIEAADLAPWEKVLVANISNGSRAETYVLEGERGSGQVCLNGAAARLGEVGDLVIVMAFRPADEAELKRWRPRIVHVDEHNRPVEEK